MKTTRPIQIVAIAAVLIAYIVFRFWNLTASCLWFDEIFSVHAAEHSWNSILWFVAQDLIHPPLFYPLLKLWISIGGESLFWLRFLPALFSIVAIIPFLYLCRELKLRFSTQLLALLLLAVNGSLIKYSQEVRMYSLLMCLSLFSTWLFGRYFNSGKRFYFLVIVNVLLVYAHYFGWLVVFTEIFAILIYQRIKTRRILLMFAIVFASFLPWIYAIWYAARAGSDLGQNIGWMQKPGLTAIAQFVLNLIEPFYYAASSVDPISIYRISVPLLLIFTVTIVLYFANWKRHADDNKRACYLLFIFAALPVVAAIAASWLLPYSIWGTRHLIVAFAPVSILLAIAVTKIEIFWLRITTLTMLALFCGYAFVIQAQRPAQPFIWCGFETIGKEIENTRQEPVYAFEDLAAYHLWFAYKEKHDIKEWMQVVKINGVEGLSEDTAYFLPRGFDDILKLNVSQVNAEQLWIVYRAESMDVSRPPLRYFITSGYSIIDQKRFDAGSSSVFAVFLRRADRQK